LKAVLLAGWEEGLPKAKGCELFEPNELPGRLKPVEEAAGLLGALPLKLRLRVRDSSGLKTKLMLQLSLLFLDL
jgi:hypothetical protein